MKKAIKGKVLQIRLSEEDYNHLEKTAFVMGTKPSSFARQLIQMAVNASKVSEATLKERELKVIDETNV